MILKSPLLQGRMLESYYFGIERRSIILGKKLMFATGAVGTLTLVLLLGLTAAATSKGAAKPVKDGKEQCYQCHDEVKALKEGSKHAAIPCGTCHGELAKHVESQSAVKALT